ncbi:3-dehydroquinate synthase [Ornithinibacillus halotolerans]|uniref:3-dehydroquinate synthase n=1 Tax=Ornithinibacillus halotolerans TaxID=1274357 RepID=A0A916RM59_9BACI|nr:3-dehydroquinate synthase [Ornithinibacillus halotolerans]GGA61342.1 3-dehydroquinate synthase [Ornithinibacillus halotolerans]
MRTIHINSAIQSYDIVIGEKLRHQIKDYLPKNYSSILVITDENVVYLYGNDLLQALKGNKVFLEVVPPGETSKSIQVYYQLLTKALEYSLDRQSLIIAFGGGVVGDLAGFVAATYMRGVDYIQVPTTILAHDSSVGGKVAINHEKGKNLIGSFYPPVQVLYDTETIQTLSLQDVRSGYAELLKEAMLANENFFTQLLSISLEQIAMKDLITALETGINIKATIVEQDEREAGIRKYLNLGHTLGHAIETRLGYGKISHGEAVAIGILFAMYVSQQELQVKLPLKQVKEWLTENNYPIALSFEQIDDLVEFMMHDKKVINSEIQMVLLKKIGEPVLHNINKQQIKKYLHSFIMSEVKG